MTNHTDQVTRVQYESGQSRPPHIMSDDRTLLAWQRTHMANERTFLSWSRTSIGLLAFGFVMERFEIFIRHILHLEKISTHTASHATILYLSFLAFLLAGVTMVISGARFLSVRRHINRGEAKFSVLPEFLVIASVVVVVLMAILLSLHQVKWVMDAM
ncbi:MAG: DUF202 domain-containing protein [Desulfomonilaceae bacterium]|nr:DUF202 domain-containing protein [Desulfomonilaceae bacterium]